MLDQMFPSGRFTTLLQSFLVAGSPLVADVKVPPDALGILWIELDRVSTAIEIKDGNVWLCDGVALNSARIKPVHWKVRPGQTFRVSLSAAGDTLLTIAWIIPCSGVE